MPGKSLKFVASPIYLPSDAFFESHSSSDVPLNLSPYKVWAALAVQGSLVMYRRAENLSQLIVQLRADCLETWSSQKPGRGIATWFKSRFRLQVQSSSMPTVLMVQPEEMQQGHLQCLPNWSPEDIEAECWLEAASLLQLPIAQVAMDFDVQLRDEALWVAHYMACPISLVNLYTEQISGLDLQLEAITCTSATSELCKAWALKPEVFTEALRLPCQGELASDYFNVFKGHAIC